MELVDCIWWAVIITFGVSFGIFSYLYFTERRWRLKVQKDNLFFQDGFAKEREVNLILVNLKAKKCSYEWCDNIAEYRDDEDRDICGECKYREVYEEGYRSEIYWPIKMIETGYDRRIPCPEWVDRKRLIYFNKPS
ncbi:hypothetical protein KAR91_83405 [Candidatus Pacearchaeota archaeon]|nr:hypothetical protein [Candidatus Pacearchaeota archaeon]